MPKMPKIYSFLIFPLGLWGVCLKVGVECLFQKHLGLWMIIKIYLMK